MIIKSTVLAVIVFLGSLTVAEAQSAAKSPGSETGSGAQLSGADATAAAVLGWNFTHAAFCLTYFDGLTTWFYVVAQDGGVWFTPNIGFAAAITPACQTGNLIAFNVFNLNGSLWNQVVAYPFK